MSHDSFDMKISANVEGWAKFESKQIQERFWDYKGIKFVENDERNGIF